MIYIVYIIFYYYYLDTTPLQRGKTSAGYQSLRLILVILNKQLYKLESEQI